MSPQSSTTQHDNSAPSSGPAAEPRTLNAANWDDEDALPRKLSATEAEAFRDQRNAPSPWRVVLMQVETGIVLSLLLGLFGLYRAAGFTWLWSALYGAATVIVPGMLMARGATRMADSKSPLATVLGLLGWTSAKMICTVVMLAIAAKGLILHPTVWQALLPALAGCLTVYWVALARRSR